MDGSPCRRDIRRIPRRCRHRHGARNAVRRLVAPGLHHIHLPGLIHHRRRGVRSLDRSDDSHPGSPGAPPPTQPGSITVSQVKSGSAVLKWKKSTDDVGVIAYRILRGAPGDPLTSLIHVDTLENLIAYTAANLRSGTSYQFGVIALDAENNNSPIRDRQRHDRHSSDTTPPVPPSNGGVRATSVLLVSRIDVTWPPSTSTDVASYRVYRDGVQVGDVALPHRKTFSDIGLAPGQSYTYTIRAVDSAGNLSPADERQGRDHPATGTVLIPRGPYLQWVTADLRADRLVDEHPDDQRGGVRAAGSSATSPPRSCLEPST